MSSILFSFSAPEDFLPHEPSVNGGAPRQNGMKIGAVRKCSCHFGGSPGHLRRTHKMRQKALVTPKEKGIDDYRHHLHEQ